MVNSSLKFIKQSNGNMRRMIELEKDGVNNNYYVDIDKSIWSPKISRAFTYWYRRMKQGKHTEFKYGTLTMIAPEVAINRHIYVCEVCNKEYKTSSGFCKHRNKCMKEQHTSPEETPKDSTNNEMLTNVRETATSITNNNNNMNHSHNTTTNNNQQITVLNVNIRDLGKENPKWLTSQLLYQVLNDIPSAIPKLLEKKHFNDAFPENKNIKVDTKRAIDKRLQVFEDGRWRVKASKQTFYKVLIDIHDVLSDALENDDEDFEFPVVNEDIPEEERMHTHNELLKLRKNARFIQKLERIRPIWEDFREKIDDQEQRTDLWEDLKTMLLDRQLAIEQGYDV